MHCTLYKYDQTWVQAPPLRHQKCARAPPRRPLAGAHLLVRTCLCAIACAMCIVYCTSCIAQCAFYIMHFAMCIVQCAVCIVHCALHIMHGGCWGSRRRSWAHVGPQGRPREKRVVPKRENSGSWNAPETQFFRHLFYETLIFAFVRV